MTQQNPLHPSFSVTFLGTGTSHGIPVPTCECAVCHSDNPKDKRFRSAIWIRSKNTSLVVDTGPDFRMQMLRAKVPSIDAILMTHEHRDHIGGLDDIRVYNYKRAAPLDIYCYERVQKHVMGAFSYIFDPNPYPGIPSVHFKTITDQEFEIGDFRIQPIKVLHYKLEVCGFRIGPFAYVTDVSSIPEESFELLKGVDTVVLGALRQEPHISHFSLEEAIEASNRIGARETYFIHMSHDMGLHQEVQERLPKGKFLSYDQLQLDF